MERKANNDSPKRIPIRDLKIDPTAEDLLESTAMQPYVDLALAAMGSKDSGPAIAAIAALPLEKRYVWRVASALKWAFVDLETLNVEVDRQTLSAQEQQQLIDLLKHRPLQFCLFLSALFGHEQMELMIASAIKNSRIIGDLTEQDE